ncbi:seryl-tRNA synthetase [mine drainage metagenome]|uniref:serine--tRNA ligase n=1 Tax=mine drainage metagenome TaxID=410659 RepID=T1BMY4_9ZZZZ
MIDLDLVREHPEQVEANLARRRRPEYLTQFAAVRSLDTDWRASVRIADDLRRRRNELSRQIAEARTHGGATEALAAEAKALPERMREVEAREAELRDARDRALRRLPNLLDESVPYGRDDSENVVVATWGEPGPIRPDLLAHAELLERLGMADFDRAHRVSGAGFYYLFGDFVLLDLALQRFALDLLVARGFTPVAPPYLLRRAPYEGVTDLADFENVMYRVQDEDLYLIATSEHPLAALHVGELLDEDDLPLRLAGVSPCFRKEIGGHGVDQKGIFRTHQFQKVEQFAYARPEESPALLEELRANAEEVFRQLGVPYRVVNVCTGDLGTVAAQKYDIEAWFPRQRAYREVVSCSNCTDYQARRLGIRLGKAGKPGKRVPHTLNSTAVATSRGLAVILEQYQLPDGTVEVPTVLRPYLGGKDVLRPIGRPH